MIGDHWLQLWLNNTEYYSIFQLLILVSLNNYQYNCKNTSSSVCKQLSWNLLLGLSFTELYALLLAKQWWSTKCEAMATSIHPTVHCIINLASNILLTSHGCQGKLCQLKGPTKWIVNCEILVCRLSIV